MDSGDSSGQALDDTEEPEAEYLVDYELPDEWNIHPTQDPLNGISDDSNNETGENSVGQIADKTENVSNEASGLNHSDENLFACTLLVYTRQFKGQSSGSFVARWQISANSTECFIHQVWNLAKVHLNREVIFNQNADGTSNPGWGTNEVPTEEEFGKFVLFQSGRRHYPLDKLTESSNLLQSWRGKEISLLLHVYSLSIHNRTIWNSVKESLIDPSERDRSGAATTQAVVELANELKEAHGNHLEAHSMAWSFWSNSILNSPAHLRESLKDHPPQHLAHLFRAKEGPHVNAILRELTVAHTLNNSYHEDVLGLRQIFNVVESNLESLTASMKIFKIRLEALELRDKVSESMISAMETSVKVQEDQLGQQLREQVADIEDMDHM